MAEKYYGMSPYNYVGNNPIIRIDPDGRSFLGAYDMINHTGSADLDIFDEDGYADKMRGAAGDPNLTVIINGVQYNSPPGTSGGGGSRRTGEAVNDDVLSGTEQKKNNDFPAINEHLTGDIETVNGKDYILHNKEWIELPCSDVKIHYIDPLDIDGGITITVSREDYAINQYNSRRANRNAFTGTAFPTLIGIALDGYLFRALRVTPGLFLGGYIYGYSDELERINRRNKEHDKNVKIQRNNQ